MLASMVLATALMAPSQGGVFAPDLQPFAAPGPLYYQSCRVYPGSARRYAPPTLRPPQPSGPTVEYFCQDCLNNGHIALNWHGHKRSTRCYSQGDPGLVYDVTLPGGTVIHVDNRRTVWSW